jgi:hypothetical protein
MYQVVFKLWMIDFSGFCVQLKGGCEGMWFGR